MAIKLTCDYTGEPIDRQDATMMGRVHQRHYCKAGHEAISGYLLKRDLLHNTIQKQWTDGMATLRADFYRKAPKGAQLPDEPDV